MFSDRQRLGKPGVRDYTMTRKKSSHELLQDVTEDRAAISNCGSQPLFLKLYVVLRQYSFVFGLLDATIEPVTYMQHILFGPCVWAGRAGILSDTAYHRNKDVL